MAKINVTEEKEFAVVRRWLDDEDAVHTRLLVLVTEVPAVVTVDEMKQLINRFGDSFVENIEREEELRRLDWSNGNKIVPSESWNDEIRNDVALLKAIAQRAGEPRYDDIPYVSNPEGNDNTIYDEDRSIFWRRVTYASLLDGSTGEKRITLRMPLGLHSALSREAYSRGYATLNSFCINFLANAVEYGELVEEFEAQRRKPGRPKKVQDSE